jgi:uncharacterized protein
MAAIPDLTTYVRDALAVELPAATPRPGATAGDPHEAATVLHEDEHLQLGVWEVSPGTFPGSRSGYNELMIVVKGAGTITDANGDQVALAPGTVYVTRDGWTGEWEITEALRKVFVIWDDRRG